MSLWKYSFELISKELEVTKKKKQALENLFAEGKISQSTYEYLKSEIAKAISELESNLSRLKDKMATRAQELESQLSSLELLLASLEIHHAAGDISDEIYEKENKAILLGLEATKRELNDIRSSLQGPSMEAAREKPTVPEEKEVSEPEEKPSKPQPEQTVITYEESQVKERESEAEKEATEDSMSPAQEVSEFPVKEESSTYNPSESSDVSSGNVGSPME
ncbi:CdvA-like protein [Candidatus Bathyarchaeota archaeon]|nr:CdvA-like protein [Candidatus Bathyarchaeota archaeon]